MILLRLVVGVFVVAMFFLAAFVASVALGQTLETIMRLTHA